jgi:tRNA pseudouridine55 synthase
MTDREAGSIQLAAARALVDGVLLLDKPQGITSNAALQKVKRLLAAQKAGHVGTLDPMASGLLPICLGEATKFSGYMLSADKTYAAEVMLGATSSTGDAEGEITAGPRVEIARAALEAVLADFRGEIMQTPPMYSALKRDGKPLYAYARAGEVIELAPRAVTIHALALTDFQCPRFKITVTCSKGTYIRVLAEDIGRALGCGGMLTGLRRLRVGSYDLQPAIGLGALEALALDQRRDCLLPPDGLVSALPILVLEEVAARLVATGRRQQVQATAGLHRLYGRDGHFLGLGEVLGQELVPRRLMADSQGLNSSRDTPQATKNA